MQDSSCSVSTLAKDLQAISNSNRRSRQQRMYRSEFHAAVLEPACLTVTGAVRMLQLQIVVDVAHQFIT